MEFKLVIIQSMITIEVNIFTHTICFKYKNHYQLFYRYKTLHMCFIDNL